MAEEYKLLLEFIYQFLILDIYLFLCLKTRRLIPNISKLGPRYLWAVIFLGVQLAYFIISYEQLAGAPTLSVFRALLQNGLMTARAAANVINLLAGMIMFPFCRTFISFIRRSSIINRIVPFDDNVNFHIAISASLVFWSFVHVIAHYFNYLKVEQASMGQPTAESLALLSGPGWTGQVITVALFLMMTSALEIVRRKAYEVFWFTHHLFILFFGGLLLHGSFCFIKADPGSGDPCRGGPQFWKFFLASAVLYLTERMLREWRGRRETHISKVVQHPSRVVEIQIQKPSCRTKAGQYIYINCPEIATYQWHPFTLTSSPHEEFISVHIRVVGDWTSAFSKRLGCRFGDSDERKLTIPKDLPWVMIDGPYGSAAVDVFDYEVSVLVGAGIGVTPFASILKEIWYRVHEPKADVRLRKVYFIWTCRDKEAFEWFQDVLATLEEENLDGFLEIHSYLTGGLKDYEAMNIILNDVGAKTDALTSLRAPTHYGRPNFDKILKGLRVSHPATDIGVFFCGPKELSNVIYEACNTWTEATEDGTKFFYAKENF
ncbi:hypothetical protein SmJEL517_g03736 [Synchytrium microbalum]|uniref:FAD-binding FR-type domain-containing protein n=1 Tax=Synchytrium microbalum TaxID=1806994 RepID=A0A507C1Q5_9FUNG|nr:uncharacterized protein SmJEL517_g03736 [Synchytrium microbalum]TPX33298.1 hypothetical protein SmJEL517_g03736 [Synchytrium microbalum]